MSLHLSIRGTLAPDFQQLLASAGALNDDNAPLVLVANGALDLIDDARQEGRLVLAHVDNPDLIADALQAGAIDVIVGTPSAPELACRLGLAQRLATPSTGSPSLPDDVPLASLLERLIDATPSPVMAANRKGQVLVFNRSAETILGYTARYARSHMHVTDVYAKPSDARRVMAEVLASEDSVVEGMEVWLRARSGEHVPVRLSAGLVVDDHGEVLATVGVFLDLRAELNLRTRLEDTTEQLIQSEKRSAIVAVTSSAAHQLNQSLMAVQACLELMELHPELPEPVQRRIERATGQVDRMAKIVRALARTGRQDTDADIHYLDLEASLSPEEGSP